MKQTVYKGQDFSKEEVLTIPDQTMSLREIIERFIRNEPLAIGKDVSYHESEDDLEKLIRLDPVDRAAYIKKMQEVQAKFAEQEKIKAEKREQQALAQARELFLKELQEKEKSGVTPPPAK